jgi:hypothetical protein
MSVNNSYKCNMDMLRKMIEKRIATFVILREREPNSREIKIMAKEIREDNKVVCPVTDEQFKTILYGYERGVDNEW